MTRTLILTNTTILNRNGVDVAADFDSVYVAAGASLSTISAIAVDGIFSSRAQTLVDVAGFVVSDTAIATTGSGARFTIYDGGAAVGDTFGTFSAAPTLSSSIAAPFRAFTRSMRVNLRVSSIMD